MIRTQELIRRLENGVVKMYEKPASFSTFRREFKKHALPRLINTSERKLFSKVRNAGIETLENSKSDNKSLKINIQPGSSSSSSLISDFLKVLAHYYGKGKHYLSTHFPGLHNTINPYLTSITSTIKPYMSAPYLPPKQAHFWKQASMQRTPQDPASLIKQAFIGKFLGNAAMKGLSAMGRAGNAVSDVVGRGTAGVIRGLNRQSMRIPGMESGFLSRAMTKELRNPAAQRAAGQTVLGIGGAAAVAPALPAAPALQAAADKMDAARDDRRMQRFRETVEREGQGPMIGSAGRIMPDGTRERPNMTSMDHFNNFLIRAGLRRGYGAPSQNQRPPLGPGGLHPAAEDYVLRNKYPSALRTGPPSQYFESQPEGFNEMWQKWRMYHRLNMLGELLPNPARNLHGGFNPTRRIARERFMGL